MVLSFIFSFNIKATDDEHLYLKAQQEYESGDIDFDLGLVAGYKFNRNIGIFGEGRYLSYFGIDAYELKAGINVTIF